MQTVHEFLFREFTTTPPITTLYISARKHNCSLMETNSSASLTTSMSEKGSLRHQPDRTNEKPVSTNSIE